MPFMRDPLFRYLSPHYLQKVIQGISEIQIKRSIRILILSILLVLSDLGIVLYNSTCKFGFLYEYFPEYFPEYFSVLVNLLIILFLCLFFLPRVNLSRYYRRKDVLLVLLFVVLQSIRGIYYHHQPIFVLSYISYLFLLVCVWVILSSEKQEDSQLLLKYFLLTTTAFYFVLEAGSLFFLGKSQGILISNMLPFYFLGICIRLLEIGSFKREFFFWVISFLGFVCCVYLSFYLYTEDKRIQVKPIAVILMVSLFFLLTRWLWNTFLRYKKCGDIIIRRGLSILFILLLGIPFLFSIKTYAIFSFFGRLNSAGIRAEIVQKMFSNLHRGGIFNELFGYGIGASMDSFPIYYNGYILLLKSHSGLISILYENGFIGSALILCMSFYLLFRSNLISFRVTDRNVNSFLLLAAVVFTWLILNSVYATALISSNPADQTQMCSLLLFIFILRQDLKKSGGGFG